MLGKIIFNDNGRDKALTGEVISEDEFFITFLSRGREYRIGKRNIVCVEQSKDGKRNEGREQFTANI